MQIRASLGAICFCSFLFSITRGELGPESPFLVSLIASALGFAVTAASILDDFFRKR